MAVALLLVGCAHKQEIQCGRGCTSVYAEDGQLTVAHLASADPSAVERVAGSYCKDHQLGKPVIKQPPELSKHPGWAMYSFQCEDRGADAAVAKDLPVVPPAAAPQAVVDEADKFGAMCTGMGFPKATPEYGSCVSKLVEMSAQAEQLRQQQRKQAIRMIEQGLSGLSAPGAPPAPTTIRLPSGEVLTCTQTGSQVNCN